VSTPRATATVGAWGLRVVTDEDKNWWIWNDFFPFFTPSVGGELDLYLQNK
jgi:hypothetical protein